MKKLMEELKNKDSKIEKEDQFGQLHNPVHEQEEIRTDVKMAKVKDIKKKSFLSRILG